jgi:GTP-binding protein HflX
MSEIYGDTSGLGPRAIKALERIYRRRVPLAQLASPELVRSLAEASRLVKRQVGALVHRSGEVDYVVVGDASRLMLPDIGRLRAAEGRFRALRLVHTHLFGEPLTHDDIVDLTRLRLDLVCAVLLTTEGEPRALTWAYNTPPNTNAQPTANYDVFGPIPYGAPTPNFGELIASLEAEFARTQRRRTQTAKDGSAIVIHVGKKLGASATRRAKASVAELCSLAKTAGEHLCCAACADARAERSAAVAAPIHARASWAPACGCTRGEQRQSGKSSDLLHGSTSLECLHFA